MMEPSLQLAYLRDQRLAGHALSPAPVWLWSEDARQILWANPTGASIFEANSPGALASLHFDSQHPAAAQIARLAGTLPHGGAPRLERLRGFGADASGILICLCSRIALAGNSTAILVVSTERTARDLSLPDRVRCLLEDMTYPAAMFSADGELIEATPEAKQLLGDQRDLTALGAEKLTREASLNGTAEGEIQVGKIEIFKLGADPTFALLAVFPQAATTSLDYGDEQPAEASSTNLLSVASAKPHRLPFRFVWRTDADNHFYLASQEFANLLGPKTAAIFDSSWPEIARTLELDPQSQIANVIAARETFSGIVLFWPLDDSDERLAIEMSGLPVFDRDRQFKGFRGFGICRDLDRLQDIQQRRAHQHPQASLPAQPADEPESKVLQFRSAPEGRVEEPKLDSHEPSAFQELARELSKRLKRSASGVQAAASDDFGAEPVLPIVHPAREPQKIAIDAQNTRPILDRLPVGILVYRLNTLMYANQAFLEWTGYPTLEALNEAGGLDSLFIESKASSGDSKDGGRSMIIATSGGTQKSVEARLFSAPWNNENALVLMIDARTASSEKPTDVSLPHTERENRALRAILDTATDGVLVLDRSGRILSANQSAEALFGYEPAALAERSLSDLLAPESRGSAIEHLNRLTHGTGASVLDAGYEAIGRVQQGGLVPLYITMGRIEGGEKLCAVLRDATVWKRTAEELINARQAAEKASIAKSEFLAKISHEIRTPLNAIIGFSEVMVDERFGPIGNERYREYLKDIHASGEHLISLLNDLIDLSKIEAGRVELTFVSVNLNDLIQQCVAIMQQQANRERVIIRTALSANLPQIIADMRSVRQIALNLLSNSIKFTGAGGQVIVSTALTDEQEVVLRVRDTGSGISEKDLEAALEPFQQTAAALQSGSSGTGLGLPITKALVEANHGRLRIASEVGVGTLVEVAFPATRVLAQ
jgi:PAS domain S-box-containing protein